ncbi:MAG: DUF4390 domain-containing protein [Gammaproteobacteria bacterium]|jgi:hypothetical protein|nr:DUF4390 domain-containing protein [Gammaproteobacteria bacterium]
MVSTTLVYGNRGHHSRMASSYRTLLLLSLSLLSSMGWAGITLTESRIMEGEQHYQLHAQFSYTLEESVVDALKNGIPIVFLAEYAVEEITALWDKNIDIHHSEHRFVLSYREFTNRFYLISLNNNTHGTYATLREALERMEQPHDALSVERSTLSSIKSYQFKLRSLVDSSSLPGLLRPYLYTPYLWPEWKLDSGWHTLPIQQ